MTEESYEAWKAHYNAEQQAAKAAFLAAGEPEAWTTDELEKEFEVHSFSAPMVFVTRKIDGRRGSMLFQHSPRVYYNFVPRS